MDPTRLGGVGHPGRALGPGPGGGALEGLVGVGELALVEVVVAQQEQCPELGVGGAACAAWSIAERRDSISDSGESPFRSRPTRVVRMSLAMRGMSSRSARASAVMATSRPSAYRPVRPRMPGMDRQHLRPGIGRLVGDELHGLARERERVFLGLGHHQRSGQHAEELPADRVVDVGRQMVELLAGDPERPGRVAGRDQGVGDQAHEPRQVEVGVVGQPGVVPQVERLEVVLRGLLGTAHPTGVVAGPQAGGEGGGVVLGQAGVPRELGGRAGRAAVLQRPRVRRVQRRALPRQQVVVHRLGEERVPELVEVVAARHEHVAARPRRAPRGRGRRAAGRRRR